MISGKLSFALLFVPLCVMSAENPKGPDRFAIQGARIFTGAGEMIEDGTLVIDRGLVVAVGRGIPVPSEAWVIEASGKNVYPGMIDALGTLGLATKKEAREAREAQEERRAVPPSRGPEDRPGTNSFRAAADELNLSDERIESWRNAGFTSAVTVPEDGIITGQAAFINLAGERERALVVRSPLALRVNLTPPSGSAGSGRSFPESLMGVVAYVKQVFLDAAHYRESWAVYESSPRGKPRPEYDRALAPISRAQAEAWPVLMPGTRKHEIVRALALAKEMGVRPVVYGLHEGFAAAAVLAEAKVPALVSLNWPERGKDRDPEEEESLRVLELRDKAPSTPAALEKAGVSFAFYTDGISKPEEALANVRKAVAAGLSKEAALGALTHDAAAIYGLNDRLGTLEAGKIANLFIATGDIFDEGSKVETVFVDGKKFEVRATAEPTEGSK